MKHLHRSQLPHQIGAPEQVRLTTLDNGLRVVTEFVPGMNGVSLGLRIEGGSRDEAEDQAGISHLLEHMVFKGTERRSARDIAEELDQIGGQLDAYTTKEYTGYGCRVLPEHLREALEILADMLRNSRIDPAELELEKSVILEEYKSLEDSPEEFIHDVFARTIWPDHPLGRPVIGSPAVIAALSREDLVRHLRRHYAPARMICAAAGNVDHDHLVSVLDGLFGDQAGPAEPRVEEKPEATARTVRISRPIEQAHFVTGVEGVGENDPDRWAVRVLNLIAGGGMSSRLFQEIREKRGLCYSIGSDSSSFREGGLFMVYADTSADQLDQVTDLARAELQSLAEKGVRPEELSRAKNQIRSATLLSLDDTGSRMSRLARSLLYHGRVVPLAEIVAEVEALTPEHIRAAAQRLFAGKEFAFAAIGPFRKRASKSKR